MIEYWLDKACGYEGDFAEIGLGVGETTKKLLPLALWNGKTVLGVDPFESDWKTMPEGYATPYPEDEFWKNIRASFDTITLGNIFRYRRVNSLSKEAEKFLSVPLCCVFIDGLQYKGAVLSDLRIVSHAEIIIVDDFNRSSGMSQVPEAIEEYLKTNDRKLIDLGRHAVLVK